MTLIEINPNGPDEPERKLGKPIEEMARACAAAWYGRSVDDAFIFGAATGGRVYAEQARAALTVLRRHGWITSDCIDAIHAEEDDNGEARSSIIGGGKP